MDILAGKRCLGKVCGPKSETSELTHDAVIALREASRCPGCLSPAREQFYVIASKCSGPGPDQKVVSFSGITSAAGQPKTFAPSRPFPTGKADPKFLASLGVGAAFTSFNVCHAPGF
jgi:hypothetical protein